MQSKKDKRLEEVRTVLSEIRNKVRNDEWLELYTLFTRLTKAAESAAKSLDGRYPKLYYKALAELEDGALGRGKDEAKSKMSADNYRSLSTMKQQIKKHNRQYQDQVKHAREQTDDNLESIDLQEEDSIMSDAVPEEPEEKIQQRQQRPRAERQRDQVMSLSQDDVTAETVDKKLRETLLSRGRKGTDRQEMVERLAYLSTLAKSPPQCVEVLMHVISAQFDINPSMTAHMPIDAWKKCAMNIYRVIEQLNEHRNVKLTEPGQQEQNQQQSQEGAAATMSLEAEPRKAWLDGYDSTKTYEVYGNLVSYVERLDDEHFKTMQCTEPHSPEYIERMRDELPLLQLLSDTMHYCGRIGDTSGEARLAQRQIEHLYFKPEHSYEAMVQLAEERAASYGKQAHADVNATNVLYVPSVLSSPLLEKCCQDALHNLSSVVFKHGEREGLRRVRSRATLCLSYHAALMGDYTSAREIMLVSHVQEDLAAMDVSTQVIFNRAMAQLGVAAFASGLFADAASCLAELHASSKIRELLAQGSPPQRYQERTQEQEREERKRQIPFHMHLNLDLLECVHLTSAMLVEVPTMAANSVDFVHGRSSNRVFQRQLDAYERQSFLGPPESARDHIMASTLALFAGKWRRASELIRALSAWHLLPVQDRETTMSKVDERIKHESLRAYLLSHCSHYESISLPRLAHTFDLSEEAVHAAVARMVVQGDLHATLDQPTSTIALQHVKPSRLQSLALSYSEKLGVLCELNERAADITSGSFEFSSGKGPAGATTGFDHQQRSSRGMASKGPRAAVPAQPNRRAGRRGLQQQAQTQSQQQQQQQQQSAQQLGSAQSSAAAAAQPQDRQFTSLGRA